MGGGGGRRQRTDPDGPGDLLKKMEEGVGVEKKTENWPWRNETC